MKKEYTKPTAKVVEWDFNEAVCNAVNYSGKFCITIEGNEGRNRQTNTFQQGELTWNNWNEK